MKEYTFKDMIEMAVQDGLFFGDNEELHEVLTVMDSDDILIHEDDWVGPKPGKDIELFGEHWYKSHWTENDGDPMEGFKSI